MSKKIALVVAGIVFGIVAILHLLRFIFHTDIIVSGYVLPMQASVIGFIVTLILSLWMFIASRSR